MYIQKYIYIKHIISYFVNILFWCNGTLFSTFWQRDWERKVFQKGKIYFLFPFLSRLQKTLPLLVDRIWKQSEKNTLFRFNLIVKKFIQQNLCWKKCYIWAKKDLFSCGNTFQQNVKTHKKKMLWEGERKTGRVAKSWSTYHTLIDPVVLLHQTSDLEDALGYLVATLNMTNMSSKRGDPKYNKLVIKTWRP